MDTFDSYEHGPEVLKIIGGCFRKILNKGVCFWITYTLEVLLFDLFVQIQPASYGTIAVTVWAIIRNL